MVFELLTKVYRIHNELKRVVITVCMCVCDYHHHRGSEGAGSLMI